MSGLWRQAGQNADSSPGSGHDRAQPAFSIRSPMQDHNLFRTRSGPAAAGTPPRTLGSGSQRGRWPAGSGAASAAPPARQDRRRATHQAPPPRLRHRVSNSMHSCPALTAAGLSANSRDCRAAASRAAPPAPSPRRKRLRQPGGQRRPQDISSAPSEDHGQRPPEEAVGVGAGRDHGQLCPAQQQPRRSPGCPQPLRTHRRRRGEMRISGDGHSVIWVRCLARDKGASSE